MCFPYLALGTKYTTGNNVALKYLIVLWEKWTSRQTFVTEHGKGWKRKHREHWKRIPTHVWGMREGFLEEGISKMGPSWTQPGK